MGRDRPFAAAGRWARRSAADRAIRGGCVGCATSPPLALVAACLSTLGAGKAQWIADILRTFNAFTGLSIRVACSVTSPSLPLSSSKSAPFLRRIRGVLIPSVIAPEVDFPACQFALLAG